MGYAWIHWGKVPFKWHFCKRSPFVCLTIVVEWHDENGYRVSNMFIMMALFMNIARNEKRVLHGNILKHTMVGELVLLGSLDLSLFYYLLFSLKLSHMQKYYANYPYIDSIAVCVSFHNIMLPLHITENILLMVQSLFLGIPTHNWCMTRKSTNETSPTFPKKWARYIL